MKKVLLVATVQSHICQFHKPLMKLLSEHGYEIHVAAKNNLAEKDGLEMEYASKVFDINFKRNPFNPLNASAYKSIKRILKENEYDIIHCNTPVGGLISRLAAKKYREKGTKVFYTAHGFHFYKGAPKKNWIIYYPIEKFLSRYTDKLITISDEDYKTAKENFRCPVFRIHGVGAGSERFYPLNEEEQENQKRLLGLSGKIILNVGELLPNKNQKAAIKAMKDVVKKHPDALLLIAGNGKEKKKLEQLIEEYKLKNNVKLLGYRKDIHKYMQVCDVLVACSYREGLGMNVIEAMLCGKSVVASNNRGHREIILENQNGFLFSPDDTKKLSEKICYLLEKSLNLEEEIVNSVQRYTEKSVAKELKEIYSL